MLIMKKSNQLHLVSYVILFFFLTSVLSNFYIFNINTGSTTINLKTSESSPIITWTFDGVAISTASNDQWVSQIISDGMGGAFITWMDERNGDPDIYAQRINSTGDILWDVNGIPICNANRHQYSPQIISDGAGGAIITWYDFRDSIDFDIYAQRINSTGDIQWDVNGIAICTENNNQIFPKIISDGVGNVIITWFDHRSGIDDDIYAQKINSTGHTKWAVNGSAVCTANNDQLEPEIVGDDEGGAIIVWRDYRNNNNYDIYAQRINSTGSVQWIANGTVICNADKYQGKAQITIDGQGGAIITWYDGRAGPGDIYAQRINSTGLTQWTPNGTAICTINLNQDHPKIVSDGINGAIIVWVDYRGGTTDIYAQRINFTGAGQWTPNGSSICTASYDQVAPAIVTDGADGAFITWYDGRSGTDFDIYVQLVNSTGDIQWALNGEAICTAADDQSWPSIAYDGTKGAILAWRDDRNGWYSDIYAQRIVDNSNPTSNHPGSIITSKIGTETIYWVLTDDIGEGMYRVWANDTAGNFYIWQDWQSWTNNTLLNVPINRSSPGNFNYSIEYYDIFNQYGALDMVIVTIIDNIPISNHLGSIVTSKLGAETIEWILTDDFGGGMYRVWANDSAGNFYIWQDWQLWVDNAPLTVPINRSSPGIFNYTIEYYDNNIQYGALDMVIVTIIDNIPISNHLGSIVTSKLGAETIEWILTDDFGGGMYRVWANDSAGNFYIWQDWQLWVDNAPLTVPINRSSLGIFNYTIEYYDNNNQYGIPNTVIVTITSEPVEDEDPIISFGHYYVAFMVFSLLSLLILKRREIFKKT